ncbi:MAG TPA: hypothetical protein VKK79_10710 [Candidatus Lokiarchaeia archaeon]|nr:hypothetical protein [Candidatus Lokiarchaeia archaeon]
MTNLESFLAKVAPRAKILEALKLKSRKNEVWLVTLQNTPFPGHDQVIIKHFQTPNFAVEVEALATATSVHVGAPSILYQGDNYLVLEFLPGPNLCDVVNSTLDSKYIQRLAEWLAAFHNASQQEGGTVLLKGDARLRNFISQDEVVYGLDFEEARQDFFVLDVAEAAGSIFDTSPGCEDPVFFPVKMKMVGEFLKSYENASTIPFVGEILRLHFIPQFVQDLRNTMKRRDYLETSLAFLTLNDFLVRLEAGEIDTWNL